MPAQPHPATGRPRRRLSVVLSVLVAVSEVGADMSKFPDDKHFASWLGLCPGTKITGGLGVSGRTRRVANRATLALKLAAAALRTSRSALGAYYRRLCARMDKPKAVTAAAHKLARLIYAMLTKGEECTDRGQACCDERYRQRVVANLTGARNNSGCRSCRSRPLEIPPADQLLGRSFLRDRTVAPPAATSMRDSTSCPRPHTP